MTTESNTKVQVNITRVRDVDGFTGTVRYVGPVASAKNSEEIYAGVEWDDESRGKHDGSVISRETNEIVRHFVCESRSSAAASFIKLSKLDTGLSLTKELLQERYVMPEDPRLVAPVDNVIPDCYAMTSKGHKKPIELHGELQIRRRQQLDDLQRLSVRCAGISSVELANNAYHHILELDLAGNLLCRWQEVIKLLQAFSRLERLSLASNKLLNLTNNDIENIHSATHMQVLNLNECGITSFSTVVALAKWMPQLQELCLARNDLSRDVPELDQPLFTQLTLLDLSHCQLTSWKQHIFPITKAMPEIQQLILNDNSLTEIGDNTTQSDCFPLLISLHLNNCNIQSWRSINYIASHLSNLRSLTFRNNPLTNNMGAADARGTVVAKIPHLQYLNASNISTKERHDSERRYAQNVVRHITVQIQTQLVHNVENIIYQSASLEQKLQQQKQLQQDILEQSHYNLENLHTLLARHFANPQEQPDATLDRMTLVHPSNAANSNTNSFGQLWATDTVTITVKSMVPASCTMQPMTKRLPTSFKIGRLKAMCARYFGHYPEKIILHCIQPGDPFPTPLDDDEHSLEYFGVMDGTEILLNEQ